MFQEEGSACVYLIQNQETGQTYIGSAANEETRRKQHMYQLGSGKHPNRRLQNAFNTNPNFEFISVPMDDREAAYDFEQALLDEYYRTPGILNLSNDARYGAHAWTDESREKARQAKLGTKASEETKAKMSAIRTGRKHSDETLEKLTERARNRAPEFREKMSSAMVGNKNGANKKMSQEEKAKLIALHSNPVIADGLPFSSKAEAAKHFGVTVTTVTNRVNSRHFEKWHLP